ncbi:MAG TPA: hypothetical protein DCZ55_18420 [Cyanobacteria bacterium UBA11371]|nr:hypothetical protein [Cyanobacteria bacterium UBA11371]
MLLPDFCENWGWNFIRLSVSIVSYFRAKSYTLILSLALNNATAKSIKPGILAYLNCGYLRKIAFIKK